MTEGCYRCFFAIPHEKCEIDIDHSSPQEVQNAKSKNNRNREEEIRKTFNELRNKGYTLSHIVVKLGKQFNMRPNRVKGRLVSMRIIPPHLKIKT